MDFGQIARELEIDESVYLSLLKRFCELTHHDLDLLDGALAKSDFTELYSAAHSIKGASASLSLTQISDAASVICEAAKEAKSDSVAGLSRGIRKEIDSLSSSIIQFDQGSVDDP